MDIRFAASEPATNKALQEVRVLGGFGLFGGRFATVLALDLPVLFTGSTFRDVAGCHRIPPPDTGMEEHWYPIRRHWVSSPA